MRRVFALAALLTASTAISETALAQPDNSQPEWIEQARIVARMQGITVGEAVRRVRLQEKVNRAIERFQNDADYAGAWIDQDARGFRATFGFKGGRKPALGDTELQEVSTLASTTRSMSDLAQTRASLAKMLREQGLKASVSVVQRTQRMELYPEQPEKLRTAIAAGTVTIPEFVDVKDGPLVFTPEFDIYGAGSMDLRSPSGSVGTTHCTGGFVVTNGTVRGIATAGHCQTDGFSVVNHWGQSIGQLMGVVAYENGLDISWFRNTSLTYLNRVRSPPSYYTITSVGPQVPAANTPVCIVKRDQTQVCAYVLNSYYRLGDDGMYSGRTSKWIGISRSREIAAVPGSMEGSLTASIREITSIQSGPFATSTRLRHHCRAWASAW